jgi:RecA-family ATPase
MYQVAQTNKKGLPMTAPATPHYNPTPTADQLLDSPLPDQTLYVLDRMLQCNNPRPSMLAGLPRGGKSTLATQIAVAVANGTDTLERPTTRGHVIFWKTTSHRHMHSFGKQD